MIINCNLLYTLTPCMINWYLLYILAKLKSLENLLEISHIVTTKASKIDRHEKKQLQIARNPPTSKLNALNSIFHQMAGCRSSDHTSVARKLEDAPRGVNSFQCVLSTRNLFCSLRLRRPVLLGWRGFFAFYGTILFFGKFWWSNINNWRFF